MKKIYLSILVIFLFQGITTAQTFLNDFLPQSAHYAGHCAIFDYQLDTLYWDEWADSYSPGGAVNHHLQKFKDVFSYLPNGFVQEIMSYHYNNHWGKYYRYSFNYDEHDRLSEVRCERPMSDGNWQYYEIYEYTYDNLNRVSLQLNTYWMGDGFNDTQYEYQYEYDEDGHLISKSIYGINDHRYFSRWLYEYENDKMISRCYQQWSSVLDWGNRDLYLYTYENNKIANIIHQQWNYEEEYWYNNKRSIYEYHPENGETYIILQSWNDDWINSSRSINSNHADDLLVTERVQKWQNEEWADNRICDYSVDSFGNLTEAIWKDCDNGYWVASNSNNPVIVSYNNDNSVLSATVRSYRAVYSKTQYIDDINANHTNIYPNPGQSYFVIKNDRPLTYVIVYDMMGHQMFSQSTSASTIRINTEFWPSGMYLWKISDLNSESYGKWLKQ